MVKANLLVRNTGVHNFEGAWIMLPSSFKFDFIEKKLQNYHDKIVVEFLKFGFPLGHDGKMGSKKIPKNHLGATRFPKEMEKILKKEV